MQNLNRWLGLARDDRAAARWAALVSAPVRVIKLGGRALAAPGAGVAFARALARHPGRTLLVHGGGAEVTAWCERLGLAPRFEDGLRVTDDADARGDSGGARRVSPTSASWRPCARPASTPLGLAALDGGTSRSPASPTPRRLGHVGEVAGAEPSLARWRSSMQVVLRCSPASAPTRARCSTSTPMTLPRRWPRRSRARALVLLSDTPGLRAAAAGRRHALIAAALGTRSTAPDVSGGMRPKLRPPRRGDRRRGRVRACRRMGRRTARSPHCCGAIGHGTRRRPGFLRRARAMPDTPAPPRRHAAGASPPKKRYSSRRPIRCRGSSWSRARRARVRDAAGRDIPRLRERDRGATRSATRPGGPAPARWRGRCANARPLLEPVREPARRSRWRDADRGHRLRPVFFCNSGTEGIEAALKFARVHAAPRGSRRRATCRVPRRVPRPHRASRSRSRGRRPTASRSSR